MIVLLTLYPIAMLELLFLNPLTQVPRGGQRPQLPGIH